MGDKIVLKVFLGGTSDERAVIDGSDKCATVGVPRVVARRPRQLGRERSHEIVDGPADDGIIVHTHVEIDDANGVAHSCVLFTQVKSRVFFLLNQTFKIRQNGNDLYLSGPGRCASRELDSRCGETVPGPAPCRIAAGRQRPS